MNRFRRSIVWLVLLVVVPLGALTVMQYRFLRSLQQTTAEAEQNWLRNSLEEVTHEIENNYRMTSEQALSLSSDVLTDVAALTTHFRASRIPGARTLFAIHYENQRAEWAFFDPDGSEKTPGEEDEVQAVKLATVTWHVAHTMERVVAQPTLYVDERDPHNRIIMRPVVDDGMRVVGVAGAILDDDLARAAMIDFGAGILRRRYHGNELLFRIGPEFTAESGFITHPLRFIFTNWRAGLRGNSATPEEIADTNFRANMLWTGGVSLMLFGAIALTVQSVARHMKLSQMKSDFVSNVSHELRTPLASIRVFGEYMRLGRVTRQEKIVEYGEYIEAESRRLTQLINNILDFSRIESSQKTYKFVETEINEFVEETVDSFVAPRLCSGGLQPADVALKRDATPVVVAIDRDAIAQVLLNLLDNAVKFSAERKQIEVRIEPAIASVRIAVRDRGIGIAPGEQKKIFDKFYRAGSALVHDVRGSGLGLTIVQHVIEAHGGRIEVDSRPGEGSTFTIVLPCGAPAPSPAFAERFA
ncbi:MAG TPA: HAMP domain-containing sensor histidine kinase [Thermoanaerobaculia bacterium]|nr:HAMP domain-containing sensor histidine kinase [Thermoanaerobaculia bacterium]